MGFDYAAASKAWMNEQLFRQWLYRFDTFIAKTTKHETILLLDNASCHGQIDTLPTFSYLRIKFLPKRTTPILQPLDAVVIACIKRRYHRRLCERGIDLVDNGVFENTYQVDLKLAITCIYDIWYRMESIVFRNC